MTTDEKIEKIFSIINFLVKEKIIEKYAVGGTIGMVTYTEPFSTKDVDIFLTTYLINTTNGIIRNILPRRISYEND